MSISMQKGGNVSLTKAEPGLEKIIVGLGWDVRKTSGADFDLDASVFMLTAAGKVRTEKDFIFYNNLKSAEGSVEHMGDNRTGAGEGDDEVVRVDLMKVPPEIVKIVFTVSIYEAQERHQNFGMVASAFIRILNNATRKEIARYDITEEASTDTALIFGEVYRYNNEWKFKAVGQGFTEGFVALVQHYGLEVG